MVEEKQLADKVRGWLQGEGIFREEVETDKTDFHFIVNFPAGSNYVSEVIKPKEMEYLIVGTSIQLADEHYKALHSLPKAEKEALLWQWRFDLLFRNAEFRMVPSARELRGVEFTRSIYIEDLSRTALMDAIRELFKCKLYVIWRVAQLMGRSESEGAIYR